MVRFIVRTALGALTGIGLVLGLTLLAPPAQAATSAVSIGAASSTPAIDTASLGTVTTPKVTATGKAKITSRSFVVRKAGRVVAKTATAGKRLPLGVGSYQLTTKVTFVVGKKTSTVTKTATLKIGNSPRMSLREYRLIRTGQTPAQVSAIVGGRGTVAGEDKVECTAEEVAEGCEPFTIQIRTWQTVRPSGYALIVFLDGRVNSDLGRDYQAS